MRKLFIILLHLAYWGLVGAILLMLLFIISNLTNIEAELPKGLLWRRWIMVVVPFVFLPGGFTFYMNYFFFFERFLRRRKLGMLFIGEIAGSIFAGLLGWLILSIVEGSFVPYGDWAEIMGVVVVIGGGALINGVVGLVLKGFVTWYEEVKLKEELAKKNHEMEMELIKAQLNPHFLFNTLNNIDVLIETQPEKASDYLKQLSEIMRFMLYDTQGPEISLKQEIEYIQRYLELQKIRSASELYVSWKVLGDGGNQSIPPMLFFPLIENAFKHLVHHNKQQPGIKMELIIHSKSLRFVCINQFKEQTDWAETSGGLGLELIRKRLAALFPGKHELTAQKAEGRFRVDLIIELS